MAEAIPLRDPAGLARVYACGLCLRIGSSGGFLGGERLDDKQLAKLAEASEGNAASCCTCQRCKKPAPCAVEYDWVCKACKPLFDAEEAEWAARCAAAEEQRSVAWTESLKLAKDSWAACGLLARMSDLSEEYYCAGWLSDCEFTLWGFVVNGPGSWGLGEFQQSEADELRELSDKAGGWIVWDSGVCGNLFVPAEEWARRYADG